MPSNSSHLRFHSAAPAAPALSLVEGDLGARLPETEVRAEKSSYDMLRDQLRGELERSIYEVGGMRVKWLKVHSFVLGELDSAIGECVREGVTQKQREARFAELIELAEGCDLGGGRANTLYVNACRHKVLSGCAKLDESAHTQKQRDLEVEVGRELEKQRYLHALRHVLIQPEYHRPIRVPIVIEKHLTRAEQLSNEALQEASDGRFSKARACAVRMCTATDRATRAAKYGMYRAPALRPHDAKLVEQIFYSLLENTLASIDLIRHAKKGPRS